MQEESLGEQRLRMNARLAEQRLKRLQRQDHASDVASSLLADARRNQETFDERQRDNKLSRQQQVRTVAHLLPSVE